MSGTLCSGREKNSTSQQTARKDDEIYNAQQTKG